MSLEVIFDHPTYNKLLRFLDTTPKREKSYRLVAYLSRFLAYYLQRQGFSPAVYGKFLTLKTDVSFIRKAMRFLKPLNHLKETAKLYDNKNLAFRWSAIIRNLAYAGYLTCDGLQLLKLLKLLDAKTLPNVSKYAAKFWLIGILASLVGGLQKVYYYNQYKTELRNAEKNADQLKQVNANLYTAKRKIVWDLLDGFIACNTLGYLHFTEGDVGLAGTLTSIMGLEDMWKAT
ncbi:peroxisomal membrane protein PMP27 [Diutina catenulata]